MSPSSWGQGVRLVCSLPGQRHHQNQEPGLRTSQEHMWPLPWGPDPPAGRGGEPVQVPPGLADLWDEGTEKSTSKVPTTVFRGGSGRNAPPSPGPRTLGRQQRTPTVIFPPGPHGAEQQQAAQQGPEDPPFPAGGCMGQAQARRPPGASPAPGMQAPVPGMERGCLGHLGGLSRLSV